jgi:fructokinase
LASNRIFAAVEAGGTKFVCGIGSFAQGSLEQIRVPTGEPRQTIAEVIRFFQSQSQRHGQIAGLGIGSFGPLDLDSSSPSFGSLTTTPKAGWSGVNLLQEIAGPLAVTAAINTDVNVAALAEARLAFGDGPGLLAYVTVGTGIGVGFAEDGRIWRRKWQPEAGHMRLRRLAQHASFDGICPYHGDCLEGLASGPAIGAAWGASLDRLPSDHPAWEVEADYVAQLCAALLLAVSPDQIVIGGGVFSQRALYDSVRERTLGLLGGYRAGLTSLSEISKVIRAPASAIPPGLAGAYLLAEQAA